MEVVTATIDVLASITAAALTIDVTARQSTMSLGMPDKRLVRAMRVA